ncbi:MAG: LLM class flavin-dependent oxidoreductase [Acidobacteriota bacterium]
MRIGINLPPRGREIVDDVALADKLGYEYVGLVDSQLLWQEVYCLLALCAERTSAIRLGPGVTNPVTRHPAVTASAIATIDELSGGRAVLSLGRGDSAVHTVGLRPVSGRVLREYAEVCRRLTAGEEVICAGHPLRLRWARRPVPIALVASGPKTLALAGEIADRVTMLVGAEPSLVRWAIDHVRRGAESGGRDLRQIDLGLYLPASVADDPSVAREEVRPMVAAILNVYAQQQSLDLGEVPTLITEEIELIRGRYDYTQHTDLRAAHARAVTDRAVDLVALIGSVERCRERLAALTEVGIGHSVFFLEPLAEARRRRCTLTALATRFLR